MALEHRNALAMVHWAQSAFGADELAGVLGATSICFDLSVFEIFATLAAGGTLLLVPDLFALPEARFRDEVTLVNTVPTPMAELLRLGPLPGAVRTVCLAGEPLPPALVQRVYEAGAVARVWNLYGPSEDTTYSTGRMIPRGGDNCNIGWPITGTAAHVLDPEGQPLPPGVPGELYLAGAGVARGYWNRPEQNAERFLPNPFDTDGTRPRMYRTGDRVRRLGDGSLEFAGRADRQIKLRGFRVEPGEVETALTAEPGVRAAIVDAWQDPDSEGPARLTAWIEGTASPADLSDALAARLPGYCVPTLWVVRAVLPRLPNGKLDRKSLPAPTLATAADAAAEGADMADGKAAPLPGLEQQLAAIWGRVLGRDDLHRHAGFFALGGDSILAIQVVAQARAEGIALSPRDLFQYQTLATLAEAAAERAGPAMGQGPVTGAQSLTPIQSWFFARALPQAHHWNQAMVLAPARELDPGHLRAALRHLSDRHDALRARFHRGASGWQQVYDAPGRAPLLIESREPVTEAASALQAGFDLAQGPLWGAVLARGADGGQRLAVAAHHLIVDGVSWRVLLGDLQALYLALEAGEDPAQNPARRSTSPGAWADVLRDSPAIAAERPYWQAQTAPPAPRLPLDHPEGANDMAMATGWTAASTPGSARSCWRRCQRPIR